MYMKGQFFSHLKAVQSTHSEQLQKMLLKLHIFSGSFERDLKVDLGYVLSLVLLQKLPLDHHSNFVRNLCSYMVFVGGEGSLLCFALF